MTDIYAEITNEKIWRLIRLFIYCSVPPILLVLTITMVYGLINSTTSMNNFMIVLFQQSLPIALSYALLPCVGFKLLDKSRLSDIGLKANRYLWMDCIDILIVIAFVGYLATEGVLQNAAGIWAVHYLFVAVSEEVLVRGIILTELKGLVKRGWIAILANAVIFSLVFHSTDGIWINMLYRIPFGLVTAILREKTDSIWSSVLFHWIYDVLLSI